MATSQGGGVRKALLANGGEMSTTKSSQGGLTRRSFLKSTGVAAGAVAAIGASGSGLAALAAEDAETLAAEERHVLVSGCRGNCGSRCPQTVTVREGKVVGVKAAEKYMPGDEHRRRLCVKGYSQPQRMYDPDRIKYPMKRTTWSLEEPNGDLRGNDEWERVSWDEAIEQIAAGIGASLASYGGTSVGVWSSYGSYGMLNGAMGGYMSAAYGRFITAIGGVVLGAGADTAQQHVQTTLLGIGGNDFADAANAKTIVAWGGNPAEAYVHAWHYICDAREAGARLITVDPQFTASAMHSDVYVPVRPGTDGAMILACCNYIIDNNLMDTDFMKSSTVSPLLIKESGKYVRMSDLGTPAQEGPLDSYGQPTVIDPCVAWDASADEAVKAEECANPALEGTFEVAGEKVTTVFSFVKEKIAQYTVEMASKECDVPAEQIVELALAYAQGGPVYTMTFQGLGHHVNSHHNYKGLGLLHALTGNAGKPGASMCGAPAAGLMPFNAVPFMMGMPGASMCGMYLPKLVKEKAWGAVPVDLHVLWCCNGNVLSCESGRLELIEAVKTMDLVVCADVSMTDTARYADFVLPIGHAYETLDWDPVCSIPYTTLFSKAVEPAFECKSDLEIMSLVAAKLNMPIYTESSPEEILKKVIDGSEYNAMAGYTFEAIKANEMLPLYTFTDSAKIPPVGSTDELRVKYYIESPTPRNNFGQEVADYERYPYYEHAHEAYWENPLRDEYPLFGCSEHNKYHVHSQLAYTPAIRELEPEPTIKINASDAAERGIAQGDIVRVFNHRGYAVVKAVVTEGIKPGVVSIPHGWQREQFIEGHTQDLTSVVMNDFCSNSAFYDFLCQVEKYQ